MSSSRNEVLSPVHTGDYSRRFRRQSPNSAGFKRALSAVHMFDCRRKRRLSPYSATKCRCFRRL